MPICIYSSLYLNLGLISPKLQPVGVNVKGLTELAHSFNLLVFIM